MPPLETPSVNTAFKAYDFHLLGVDGKYHSISSVNTTNGLVIAFVCNHCPYVQSIAHKIARDANDLQKIGIGFIAINSNDVNTYPDDSYDNMKIFAQKHQWNFPYLFDETQKVAKEYDAVCTPDFFGFNKGLELQYRGRLDSAGKNDFPNAERELYNTMKMIFHKKDINDIKQYPSIGCSIKWKNS